MAGHKPVIGPTARAGRDGHAGAAGLALVSADVWRRVQTLIDERSLALRPRQNPKPVLDEHGEPKLNKLGQPIVRRGLLNGREPGSTTGTFYGRAVLNPLNGLLICGTCGGPVSIIRSRVRESGRVIRYLGCRHQHQGYGRPCANSGFLRLADLEASLADALQGYFSDARLAAEHHQRFLARLASVQKHQTEQETKAKADLETVLRETLNIQDAIRKGLTGRITQEMLTDAEHRRDAAQARLAEVQAMRQAKAPEMLPPREILKDLRAERLTARRATYRRLIEKITLTPTRKSGKRTIWRGELKTREDAGLTGVPKWLMIGEATGVVSS